MDRELTRQLTAFRAAARTAPWGSRHVPANAARPLVTVTAGGQPECKVMAGVHGLASNRPALFALSWNRPVRPD